MYKYSLLYVLITIFFLVGCYQENDPEINLSDMVSMHDKANNYLVFRIAVKNSTKATEELLDVWIDAPYEEVIIAEYTNVYSLDSVFNQKQFEFPVQIVEGESIHIIFSSDEEIDDATQLNLKFNDHSEEIEF